MPWLPHLQTADDINTYVVRIQCIYFKIVAGFWQPKILFLLLYLLLFLGNCDGLYLSSPWYFICTLGMFYLVTRINSCTPQALMFWGLLKSGIIIQLHFIALRKGCFHLCAHPQRLCNHQLSKPIRVSELPEDIKLMKFSDIIVF